MTVFCVQAFFVVLISLHRQADVVRANAIGLVVVLIGGAVLLPTQGALGGAIAAVGADVVLALVMFGQVRRAGVGRHLRLGLLPRIAVAAAAAAATGLTPGVPDALATALAGCVFAVMLVAVRGVPSEVLDAVSGLLRRRGRTA